MVDVRQADRATGQRAPVTPEDLCALRFVGDPQMSPDGRQVAFVVTTIDRDADEYRSHIWLVPADGSGEPIQFTRGPKRDTSPRWSPDGRHLAFISDRAERNQLWVIDTSGGEARQLTRLPHGVSAPVWAPDSRRLAFVARVGPADSGTEAANGGKEAPKRPKPIVIRTLKHKADGEGFKLDRWRQIFVISLDGGEPRQVTSGDYEHNHPAWSPDGRSIAYTSARTEKRDYDNVWDVYLTDVEGATHRCLTTGAGPASEPVFSPDGRLIAYRGHDNPEPWLRAASTKLWVVPVDGGAPRCLTRDWDVNLGGGVSSDMRAGAGPQHPVWAPDGTALLFAAHERGNADLYRCDVASGAVTQLTRGEHAVLSFSASANGQMLACAITDPGNPGDVWSLRADGTEPRQLTRLNEAFLSTRYVAPPRPVAYPTPGGGTIEGWTLDPADFGEQRSRGERVPMILEIHGGPHAMYGNTFFHEFQILVGRGFRVLYTNPRGSQGYGQEHAACLRGDWGGVDYADLMAAVDGVLAEGEVDPERLGVTGGSYGGYMTNWIIGHTDRFRAAVTQRSVTNWYSMWGTSDIGPFMGDFEYLGPPWEQTRLYLERSPITYVKNMVTPLLILHSDNDLRCPIEQAEQLFTSLKWLGREVEFVRFPGQDHNLSRSGLPSLRVERLRRIADWLERYLQPAAAASRVEAGVAE